MLEDLLSEKHRRRRERQVKFLFFASAIVIVIVIVGILWLFTRSPFFRIQAIVIRGNSSIPGADVKDLLYSAVLRNHGFVKSLLGLDSLLAWPSGMLPASDTNLIPQLADLSVSKNYFTRTVSVAVAEREPFGIWCLMPRGSSATSVAVPVTNEGCFCFDRSGTIFEKTFDTQGSALFAVHDYSQEHLGLNGQILSAPFAANMISILNVLMVSQLNVR